MSNGGPEWFKTFLATYNVTLGMFHCEFELFYILTQSPACLTQQSPADHPVSFLAMLNMSDHACTIFSIERHTLAMTEQPVELHQVLTDCSCLAGKILWACSNGRLGDRSGEFDVSVFRKLPPIVEGNPCDWFASSFDSLLL